MTEHQSTRTLVKSAPELWAECSDAASLARHLGAFGEIRITRLEPESTVAWEGAAASGTVKLEPSGWGTRVTMTMVQEGDAAPPVAAEPPPTADVAEPPPDVAVPPPDVAESQPMPAELREPRGGMLARFRLRWRRAPEQPLVTVDEIPAPEAIGVETPAPEAVGVETPAPEVVGVETPAPEAVGVEIVTEPTPVLTGNDALAAALDSLGRAHHRPYSRS